MRSAAILVAVAVLMSGGKDARADLRTDLQGYWQFNGDGSDSSGNTRDLTLRGGIGFTNGLFGNALDLQRDQNKFADRPTDDAIFDFGTNDFTIQTWVLYNDISGEQVAIEKLHGCGGMGGEGWTLTKLTENRYQFCSDTDTVNIYSSILTIDTGVWHQLVTRRNGGALEIWFDGEVVGSTSIDGEAITDTNGVLLVGRRNPFDLSRKEMDGRVDEVAVWTRAISNSEITYLYNGSAGREIPEPATLSLLALGGLTLLRRKASAGRL